MSKHISVIVKSGFPLFKASKQTPPVHQQTNCQHNCCIPRSFKVVLLQFCSLGLSWLSVSAKPHPASPKCCCTHCNTVKEVCAYNTHHQGPPLAAGQVPDWLKLLSLTYSCFHGTAPYCLNSSHSTPLLMLSSHHCSHASPFQAFVIALARNTLLPTPSDLELPPFVSPSKLILPLCLSVSSKSWRHTFSQSSTLIPTSVPPPPTPPPTPPPHPSKHPLLTFHSIPFIYLFVYPAPWS